MGPLVVTLNIASLLFPVSNPKNGTIMDFVVSNQKISIKLANHAFESITVAYPRIINTSAVTSILDGKI